ncbi:AAA family ATPase [Paenibacillus sp. FSL H8-0079]|uniref:AAA family ATPase n=1 Tax=Paenibacillus sp. FSL H8-0079 TaxID=2921375 RepID=UPI0030EDAAD5
MDEQMRNRKKNYTDWLRRKRKSNGQSYSENTISSYVSALTTAPARLSGVSLETTNVFEVDSVSEYSQLRLRMEQAQNFNEINEKAGNRAFQYSLAYYEEFLREFESRGSLALETKPLGEQHSISDARPKLLDKNIILYGPPGTGKTYHTVLYAVSIIENKLLDDIREEAETAGYDHIKTRYDAYKAQGQIAFTTFHQSYGYEEFIEGIKPQMLADGGQENSGGDISYEIAPGIFRRFCEAAQKPIVQDHNDYGIRQDPTIWKVSLGGSGENALKADCFNHDRIRIGWDSYGEILNEETNYEHGGQAVLNNFIVEMAIGDLVLVLHDKATIDAIGVVTGDYEWLQDTPQFKRSRKVSWLAKNIRENVLELNGNTNLTLSSVYRLSRITLADVLSILEKKESAPMKSAIQNNEKNYVFIIDEINRGNISKVFGELITLIEGSKRLGMAEETRLTLPYSQKLFGVPNNVYLLATMNTADRSIARLDTALRRRFTFAEMMPDPGCLASHTVSGQFINLSQMLETMNRRIEVLYDREHTIGHAYFIEVNRAPSLELLGHLFQHTIIPLLQEYFYDDVEKIRLVLGDNNKPKEEQFIVQTKVNVQRLFGNLENGNLEDEMVYRVNTGAFEKVESYLKIYDSAYLD